jgi:hypothetical protein
MEINMSAASIQSVRPSRRIGAWTLQGVIAAAFLAAGFHVFVLHTSPVPAIVLGLLNAVVVYLRRDELVALLHRVKG